MTTAPYMVAEAPPPGPTRWWRPADPVSALVYALIFVTAVSQLAIVPLLPEVAHHYALRASELAWILTLPSIAMLVTSAPIGMLGDRLGNRRVTLVGAAVLTVGVVAQGVPSLEALVVARLLFGVGYGALWTTGLAWLSEGSAAAAPRRLGMTVTASAVGSTVGPTLAGVLASRFGFAMPFLVAGGISAVITVALVSRSRPVLHPEAATTTGSIPAVTGGRGSLAALRSPAVLAGALTLALSGGVGALLQLLVPLQLHSAGSGAQTIGFVLSAAAVVYIVVSAASVHLGPRITNRRANAWMASLMAVALVPAVIGTGTGWVVAALMVVVIPRAVTGTVAYSLATTNREKGGPGTGAILGLLNTLWAVATVVAPVAAGALKTAFDARTAYLAAFVVVAAVAAWLVHDARSEAPVAAGWRLRRSQVASPAATDGAVPDWPAVALHPPVDRDPTGQLEVLAPGERVEKSPTGRVPVVVHPPVDRDPTRQWPVLPPEERAEHPPTGPVPAVRV